MEYSENQIKITFDTEEFVIVQFLNNTGANMIYNKLRANDNYNVDLHKLININLRSTSIPSSDTYLNALFDKISRLGLKHNITIPEMISQQELNYYHRFFTSNAEWLSAAKNNKLLSNPYNENFFITNLVDIDTFLAAIWEISQEVHEIEQLLDTDTERNLRDDGFNIEYLSMKCMPKSVDNNLWTVLDDASIQSSYIDSDANVMLYAEVQGKTILQGFLDEDDPNQEDIGGREGTYGSFVIDLDNRRRELYNSDIFNNWLSVNNITLDDALLEYPIGKIIESTVSMNPKTITQIQ